MSVFCCDTIPTLALPEDNRTALRTADAHALRRIPALSPAAPALFQRIVQASAGCRYPMAGPEPIPLPTPGFRNTQGIFKLRNRLLHCQHPVACRRLFIRTDKLLPHSPRMLTHLSVRSSAPLAPQLPLRIHVMPQVQLRLAAAYSVLSLICSSPRLSSIRSLLLVGVRITLRVLFFSVTGSTCRESCSACAIYGRSGSPSWKAIATSVPWISGK